MLDLCRHLNQVPFVSNHLYHGYAGIVAYLIGDEAKKKLQEAFNELNDNPTAEASQSSINSFAGSFSLSALSFSASQVSASDSTRYIGSPFYHPIQYCAIYTSSGNSCTMTSYNLGFMLCSFCLHVSILRAEVRNV